MGRGGPRRTTGHQGEIEECYHLDIGRLAALGGGLRRSLDTRLLRPELVTAAQGIVNRSMSCAPHRSEVRTKCEQACNVELVVSALTRIFRFPSEKCAQELATYFKVAELAQPPLRRERHGTTL